MKGMTITVQYSRVWYFLMFGEDDGSDVMRSSMFTFVRPCRRYNMVYECSTVEIAHVSIVKATREPGNIAVPTCMYTSPTTSTGHPFSSLPRPQR